MTTTTRHQPRVAVITGASSGVGLSAARTLASQGWRVIGTGRDPQRTATAAAQLQAVARPGAPGNMIRVDLALLADAARAAEQIRSLTDRIDVLINNAGGTARERVITSEGNEATFTGNHLGHFVLTRQLLPLLQRSAADAPRGATRIINVSSRAHETAPGLDWDNLQMIEHFVPIKAYCNAKLANLLFTRVLSEQLSRDGIVTHAMHPGIVDSNFINHADDGTKNYLATMPMVSSDEAADTVVWLATAPEPGATTNGYYYQRQPAFSTDAAKDAASALRLWRESEKLAAAALGHC
ncbi:MAG TPA: SDR family NAD(P)-dependent oxidoreductase [Steroidobacteraceae bacterium]|jgi:NAD(P)-dependent dehydrogenase (short-subunit alcohol dehydrogenase family)|nr:SDR family NAD(P)-dependent oxidoreductase [Steroidobacteraceae bacterium]